MADAIVPVQVKFRIPMYLELAGPAEDAQSVKFQVASTITQITVVLRGTTPSVTVTFRKSSDRNAVGTEVVTGGTVVTNTTTGQDITTFDSAGIAAGDFLWVETTAQSGTLLDMAITIFGTED